MFQIITHNTFIGRELIYLPSCHSTNEIALNLVKVGNATNGLVVITANQTKGKGQRGNIWLSEPNQNLTFSIILQHEFIQSQNLFDLNICVSLAINKYLSEVNILQKCNFTIKWPNDILHDSQKLGGILIENSIKSDRSVWSVIGIGLNVNQLDFKYLNATSMRNVFGTGFDLQNVLAQITQNLEFYLNFINIQTIDNLKQLYLNNLYKYNQVSHFKVDNNAVEGKIIDIDNIGRLVVEIDGEIKTFTNQEIKFLVC